MRFAVYKRPTVPEGMLAGRIPVTFVVGVTGEDAEEDAEVPAAFVAVTVKVYEVPFERPVTAVEETEVEVAI